MCLISMLLFALLLIALGYNRFLRKQLAVRVEEEYRVDLTCQAHIRLKLVLARWVELKSKNKEVASYLRKHGINRVAIYGVSDVGETLWKDLEATGIEVVCGIDRAKAPMGREVRIPERFEEDVDAIIVTPIYFFSEIFNQLNQRLNGRIPILGLDEIVFELCSELEE